MLDDNKSKCGDKQLIRLTLSRHMDMELSDNVHRRAGGHLLTIQVGHIRIVGDNSILKYDFGRFTRH